MLIPSVRRSALGQEEDELRRKLGALEEGAGMARMGARMNELWAAVGTVQAARERSRREGAGNSVEWAVVDEEGLATIAQVRCFLIYAEFITNFGLNADFARPAKRARSRYQNSTRRLARAQGYARRHSNRT